MKKKLKNLYLSISFDYSFPKNIIALFLNPFYFIRKNLYKGLKEAAPTMQGKLLDFGCGSKPYASLFENVTEYVGLDIETSGHNHENELIDVYYDGNTLPFQDDTFDCAFSSEVFEHVPNLDAMLLEINRVLKTGGRLIVTCPFVWNEHEIPYDFQRFTHYGITKRLEDAGFKIIELNKLTGYVEILAQMQMEYVRHSVSKISGNLLLLIITQLLIIFPIALLGTVLSIILPYNDSLYGNNLVICEKTDTVD